MMTTTATTTQKAPARTWSIWARKGDERVTLGGLSASEAAELWSSLDKDGWAAMVCS